MNDINIHNLCNEIMSLGHEQSKELFLKHYQQCKEAILVVDSVLDKPSDIDNAMSVQELFTLLDAFEVGVREKSLSVIELKTLMDLIECINKKLTQEANVIFI